MFGQEEVEALLPWPPPWGTFPEEAMHQRYRQTDRQMLGSVMSTVIARNVHVTGVNSQYICCHRWCHRSVCSY